jgi:hypothetical protein
MDLQEAIPQTTCVICSTIGMALEVLVGVSCDTATFTQVLPFSR